MKRGGLCKKGMEELSYRHPTSWEGMWQSRPQGLGPCSESSMCNLLMRLPGEGRGYEVIPLGAHGTHGKLGGILW